MVSQITSETIDAAYPVAGVDNDTQGFRDNFSIIKSNFATAKSEITELQTTTAKLNADNNFNGSGISYANLQAVTYKTFVNRTVTDAVIVSETPLQVSFDNGHYQKLTFNLTSDTDEINIQLQDWPEDGGLLAKMTLELIHTPDVLTADALPINLFTENGGTIKVNNNWPTNLVLDPVENSTSGNAGAIILEFWTYDAGSNVYANYLGTFREL